MIEKISIVSMSSISACGLDETDIWENYLLDKHTFHERPFGRFKALVSDIKSNGINLRKNGYYFHSQFSIGRSQFSIIFYKLLILIVN